MKNPTVGGAFAVFLFILVVGVLQIGVASGSDTTEIKIDVYAFPDIVSVEVPDFVDMGNVTAGFSTDPTSADKFYINNTGTRNVTVTPKLLNGNDIVFDNLYFTRRLSGADYNYQKIGQFSFDIPWSGTLGKSKSDYIYMKLDLSNVSGITSDLINYRRKVIFYATAN